VMIHLYNFRDQHEKIAAMQRTSLTGDGGLEPDPLVGSDDWWGRIADGSMPVVRLDGTITRVYWGSMADWPEFELRDTSGEISSRTREGDARHYVEGLSVRVDYVEHRRKPSSHGLGTHSRVVLGQWVEESLARSAGTAPGPGGAGYELTREHGEATHYLYAPSRVAGEQMLTELEKEGRIGRVWGGGTASLWIVQVWTAVAAEAKAQAPELDAFARRFGGNYDGGEIIDGEVWGPDAQP